ncbi:MAG: shikimate dehydrogenase [Alphaproteobacteria bacterium]|nr:shikimate dehydrogenase [Alphaproteobacteria bacterium]
MITGKARVAGVFGWPAGHSRSPQLHNHWLARHGIDGAYVPLPVPPEHFAIAVRGVMAAGFAGANVTIPHKGAAFALCDEVSDFARRAGAVNTLVFRDGRILGDNTDGFGFLENLRAGAPGWRAETGPAVILGAGGAARAIAAALLDAGAPEVVLVNRSADRAQAVADALGGPIRVAAEPPLAEAALLANTTSLGMVGEPPLVIDLARMRSGVVADAVYAPLWTPLLLAARAQGLAAVTGIGMLLHQARPGFAAWFGVEPVVDAALEAAVLG